MFAGIAQVVSQITGTLVPPKKRKKKMKVVYDWIGSYMLNVRRFVVMMKLDKNSNHF